MNVENTSADVILTDQSQAKIFKLKMDHFEEIFDWLSLKDLIVLGETCKRMQQIVGYYIKTNYTATTFEVTSDGIHVRDESATEEEEEEEGENEEEEEVSIKLGGLSSFLKKLNFTYLEQVSCDHEQKWKKVPYIKANEFKSLAEISLHEVKLTSAGISRIKEILGQVKTVKLYFPTFIGDTTDFYDCFLQFCTNVKKLCILEWRNTSTVGTDWLQRKYPNLEHFELTTRVKETIIELQTFFEQNPNINSFSTSIDIFLANKDAFSNTRLKLDVLSIEFQLSKNVDKFNSCRDFLNELHERGHFTQLHMYIFLYSTSTFNQNDIHQLTLFNGLTKLFIDYLVDRSYDLSPLINLKHLCIDSASFIVHMETLAKQLVNLEFLQFTHATANDVQPFIRYSHKLKTIVVFRLEKNYENILKIKELNEERSKLINARKITIYVEERVYLAVKWAKNSTNCNLIEIKRYQSYDAFNHSFDYMDFSDNKF